MVKPQDNAATPATRPQPTRSEAGTRRYRLAAAGYFVYGMLYLLGATYLSGIGEGPRAGWIWFLVGAAMAVGFPVLIWMEMKWVTRILAVLVSIRVLGLLRIIADAGETAVAMPWGGQIPVTYGALGFAVVAAAECVLLIRAGWNV